MIIKVINKLYKVIIRFRYKMMKKRILLKIYLKVQKQMNNQKNYKDKQILYKVSQLRLNIKQF